LGAVKIEIKKDHEWNNVTLNNVEIIEFLTKFRWKFDDNYICKNLYNNDITKSNGIPDFYEEITCLYADLDMYIKNIKLQKEEKELIYKIMMGYDFETVSKIIEKKFNKKFKSYQLKFKFKYICKKILEEYKYNYNYWLQASGYIKINKNKDYKLCNKCKKSYEKNIKYYPKRNESRDGFGYICRKCVSGSTKKALEKKKLNIK